MASRRSTPFAILGLLHLKPMSGYEIRKQAATSIGYFWNESYGQIYPALRELAAARLARRRTERGTRRPDRHVYEITPRGKEALRRWLAQPPRVAPVRNELLLKLFFAQPDAVAPQVEWIDRLLAAEAERQRQYAELRRRLTREQRRHPSLPHWLLTLSYGEHHSESLMRWCREALTQLAAKRSPAHRRHARTARRAR